MQFFQLSSNKVGGCNRLDRYGYLIVAVFVPQLQTDFDQP